MSEMLGRIAEAINGAPAVWRRVNKLRTDGFVYEIGYTLGDDAAPVVTEVYADYTEAMAAQLRLQALMQARAALAVLREPTHEMIRAGSSAATNVGAWRLMIDAALREETPSRLVTEAPGPSTQPMPNGEDQRARRKQMRARREHREPSASHPAH
jgi:hypothetical protein